MFMKRKRIPSQLILILVLCLTIATLCPAVFAVEGEQDAAGQNQNGDLNEFVEQEDPEVVAQSYIDATANQSAAAIAPVEVTMNQSSIVNVPTQSAAPGKTCYSMAALEIIGSDAYCLKIRNDGSLGQYAVLQKIKNFTTKTPVMTSYPLKNSDGSVCETTGHLNGMTLSNGKLIIATMKKPGQGSQVFEVSLTGTIERKFVMKNVSIGTTTYIDLDVRSISSYAPGKFLMRGFGTEKRLDEYPEYKELFAVISLQANGEISVEKVFSVPRIRDYLRQDIYYHGATQKLYVVNSKYNDPNHARANQIQVVDLSDNIQHNKSYSPERIIHSDAGLATTTMYAIQDMCITPNGTIYVCANWRPNGVENDAIFRLY